jgi:hypothetical protein
MLCNIYSVNIRYLSIQVWFWCLTPLSVSAIFQLYFWQSVFLMEETGVPGENHRLIFTEYIAPTITVATCIDRFYREDL